MLAPLGYWIFVGLDIGYCIRISVGSQRAHSFLPVTRTATARPTPPPSRQPRAPES